MAVDEVIVATGFRPNLDMLNGIRVQVDSWLECTAALGPLINPNLHSCGTVQPHGAGRTLAHPEPGFFVVGMKSYGRAPTFLLATGYEQVQSVTAFLAGDLAAAGRVELELPETGVCSTDSSLAGSSCCETAPSVAALGVEAATGGCCGGPAPVGVDACCVQEVPTRKPQATRDAAARRQHRHCSRSPLDDPAGDLDDRRRPVRFVGSALLRVRRAPHSARARARRRPDG